MSDEDILGTDSLPPSTVPPGINISLRNFAMEAEANQLGNTLSEIVLALGCYIDLSRLDGMTVAYDYDEALAEIDRGFEASRPLSRTNDGRVVGVAMAVPVMRDGVVKSHLVFNGPFVEALIDETDPDFDSAVQTVAHECGHVEDQMQRDICFPGTLLRPHPNQYSELIGHFVGLMWDEYAACRISARFDGSRVDQYQENILLVLDGAMDGTNDAIRSYRTHGNIVWVLSEAGSSLFHPLRASAYLVGHLDGIEAGFDATPAAQSALTDSMYWDYVVRAKSVLRDLWSRRGEWASIDEFEPLGQIGIDLMAAGGMEIEPLPDGTYYVDIPYTQNTTPDVS